ncbi:hypothetical protein ACLB2K_025298 [Fragaria x ananassa]
MCAICGDQPETIEHYLFHCPWTLAVWFGCSLGYTLDRGRISHLEEWLLEIHKNAGASLFRSHNSAVEAEAKALLCGVKMAVVLKLEHIIIEGDCQEVIKALNESSASPCWRISPILKKVAHLVPLFRRIHWNWVPLEANHLANPTAKLAI